MNPAIKHISLDVWQTLIHSNLDFRKKRNQLLVDHFNIKKTIDFVEEAAKARQAWCTHVNELVGKNLDSTEIALLILQDCGVSCYQVTLDDFNSFYEKMEVLFLEFPPLLIEKNLHSLLSMVRSQEISVNLLSNTGLIKGRSLRKFFQQIDLIPYFDFQLYSDEIGYSKPNGKAFELVFENASVLKDIDINDIVHIGDNEIADRKGANSYGFQAHLLDHTHATLNQYLTQHVFNVRQAYN